MKYINENMILFSRTTLQTTQRKHLPLLKWISTVHSHVFMEFVVVFQTTTIRSVCVLMLVHESSENNYTQTSLHWR